tara:strand:- start:668 stop:1192 length:525 start_codon:yes stop_codon:yes gene_type:complete
MAFYCSEADVGMRLGLDSSQRTRASTRIKAVIRRASIEIDQCFREYGRDEPSRATAESTLSGAHDAGATTVTVASGSSFATSGSGNVDGDSFSWTGKSSNDLTGVTGLSFSHATGVAVQQGEFAHVMREICADIAAGVYLEDESTHQTSTDVRGKNLRDRGMMRLRRIAHMGSV